MAKQYIGNLLFGCAGLDVFKFRTNKNLGLPEKLYASSFLCYWKHETQNLSLCELAARNLKNKFPLDFYVHFHRVLYTCLLF